MQTSSASKTRSRDSRQKTKRGEWRAKKDHMRLPWLPTCNGVAGELPPAIVSP